MKPTIEYEIVPEKSFFFWIKELLRFKELLFIFVWRDLKVKYKETSIGILWAVAQPLFMMLVFSMFLKNNFAATNSNDIPYNLYAYSGIILWNIFANGVTGASNSIISNAGIIKKIYFPRIIIPIASVIVTIIDFLIAAPFLFLLAYYYNVDFFHASNLAYFLLSIILAAIATVGFGIAFSSLNFKYKDFRYLFPFLIQLLFFATPIIYKIDTIHNVWVKKLMQLNPMFLPEYCMRKTFGYGAISTENIVVGVLIILFSFSVSFILFSKLEKEFADIS